VRKFRGGAVRRRAAALVAAGLLLSALSAFAHDFWIEPSTFRPAVGSLVEIALRVGEGFRGDPVARAERRIVIFVRVSPEGETPVEGEEGSAPAGRVRITQPGLQIVGYRSNNARVDLPAEKFEQYLKEEGLEKAIALRARRGESGKPSRENYSRCAKSLLLAGNDPSRGDRALGFTLELVAEKNPYSVAPGGEIPFRLLYRGKPLKGALVMALPQEEPEKKLTARSDAKGRVLFRLARKGPWLVKAVHITPAPPGGEVDWESLWASLTFEISGAY